MKIEMRVLFLSTLDSHLVFQLPFGARISDAETVFSAFRCDWLPRATRPLWQSCNRVRRRNEDVRRATRVVRLVCVRREL